MECGRVDDVALVTDGGIEETQTTIIGQSEQE